MIYKKLISFLFILIIFACSVSSQSRLLEEGSGGPGVSLSSIIYDSGFTSIGFLAGYSIGGIMDFGVELSSKSGTIDNNDSTDLMFSLLYNLIVIKQNQVQPLNVQLEGSYGYINTTSEYLDYYYRIRNGQGFTLGMLVYHNFFSDNFLSFTLGGKINYRNYITTTSDYTDPDVLETASRIRVEDIKYGGIAGITLHPDLWPLFNIEVYVMYDSISEKIEYAPSFSIINPQY